MRQNELYDIAICKTYMGCKSPIVAKLIWAAKVKLFLFFLGHVATIFISSMRVEPATESIENYKEVVVLNLYGLQTSHCL